MVEVTQDGAKFPGSPFQIQVGDSELCSAAKVKVQGAIKDGTTSKWNEIVINVGGAGKKSKTIKYVSTIIDVVNICIYSLVLIVILLTASKTEDLFSLFLCRLRIVGYFNGGKSPSGSQLQTDGRSHAQE